mgnify:CR=1 FL=1
MKPLEPEMYRVLLQRITKAIRKAKYHPASAENEEAIATEVLRPYAPKAPAPLTNTKGSS